MTQFSDSDINKLKRLVTEGIQVKEEVKTLNEGLRDTVKSIAEELGISPKVLNKAIAIGKNIPNSCLFNMLPNYYVVCIFRNGQRRVEDNVVVPEVEFAGGAGGEAELA